MHRFEASVVLEATPEAVFDFHQNPQNIRKISPWFLEIVEVRGDKNAVAGASFSLKLRVSLFPLSWAGIWSEVEAPSRLVDTAAGFPLVSWRHEHRFAADGNGTRMTDRVDYEFVGGMLGRLIGSTFFRLQLILMFAGRHQATAHYFSSR